MILSHILTQCEISWARNKATSITKINLNKWIQFQQRLISYLCTSSLASAIIRWYLSWLWYSAATSTLSLKVQMASLSFWLLLSNSSAWSTSSWRLSSEPTRFRTMKISLQVTLMRRWMSCRRPFRRSILRSWSAAICASESPLIDPNDDFLEYIFRCLWCNSMLV